MLEIEAAAGGLGVPASGMRSCVRRVEGVARGRRQAGRKFPWIGTSPVERHVRVQVGRALVGVGTFENVVGEDQHLAAHRNAVFAQQTERHPFEWCTVIEGQRLGEQALGQWVAFVGADEFDDVATLRLKQLVTAGADDAVSEICARRGRRGIACEGQRA